MQNSDQLVRTTRLALTLLAAGLLALHAAPATAQALPPASTPPPPTSEAAPPPATDGTGSAPAGGPAPRATQPPNAGRDGARPAPGCPTVGEKLELLV